MKKWYGSLNNRLEENQMWVSELKVGTLATKYSYSDRTPYEITKVIDQKHLFIREMKAIRTDKNGMSDAQDYIYLSDDNNSEIEIIFRYNKWQTITIYTFEKCVKRANEMVNDGTFKTFESAFGYVTMWLNSKEKANLKSGKDVKKYNDFGGLSFGKAEKYFDYTF